MVSRPCECEKHGHREHRRYSTDGRPEHPFKTEDSRFISVEDGDVYAGSLRERQWRRVLELSSSRRIDYLFVRPSPRDADSCDLAASLTADAFRKPDVITVQEHFAADAVPSWRSTESDPPQYGRSWPNRFGPALRLGDAQSSSWAFSAGIYPMEGLLATEASSRKTVRLSFEMPYLTWPIRNITHLPADKALLQLGDNQICVYDPVKCQIALLARDREPIAVIDKGVVNQPPEDPAHTPAPSGR